MKHRSKKILSYIITIAVIAVAALWVGSKFIHLGNVEFTDNAQVRRQIVPSIAAYKVTSKKSVSKNMRRLRKGTHL